MTARPPEGSEALRDLARRRHMAFELVPDVRWFRAWEPFDTMVSPGAYFSAASWQLGAATVTHAEPWYAEPGSEPLDRTLLTFVTHAALRWRAAARGGEHFNTRVVFLGAAPPPDVALGDPSWDRAMKTFAASPAEAAGAFPSRVRRLLERWGFSGHVEMHPGVLVMHWAGVRPDPAGLDALAARVPDWVGAHLSAG